MEGPNAARQQASGESGEGVPPAVRPFYPFRSRRFERRGLGLHYLDEGAGEAVLMVHGNPTWSLYYRALIQDLRRDHRCIVPDHIGMGLSDKPDDDRYVHRLESRIDDLDALMDSLDLPEAAGVTLVVHDWGGVIGLGWAARHPGRVKRLVLLNTAAFPLPPGKPLPWQLRIVRDLRAVGWLVQGANAFARIATRVACRSMSPELRRAYLAPYDSWEHRLGILRFVQDIPLGPGDPSWAGLGEIHRSLEQLRSTPALICWGLRDFIFDADFLAQWRRELPKAELLELEEAGHYVLEDAAEQIVPRVRDFLERHPLPAIPEPR